MSQIPATEGEWVIKVFVKNVAINKQYGFANFAIAATTEGKVEQVNSYSLSAHIGRCQGWQRQVSPTGNIYDEGTSVTLTATENFGYHFEKWIDGEGKLVSTSNPYTFTINANTIASCVYSQAGVCASSFYHKRSAGTSCDGCPRGKCCRRNSLLRGRNRCETRGFQQQDSHLYPLGGQLHRAERMVQMDGEKNVVADYSACDYIVGWDLYNTALRQDRAADYASETENAGLLQLRDAEGNSKSWLGSVMRDKYSARVWRPLTEKDYFEISFSTKGYKNIKVAAAAGDDYNAYSVNYMQVSTNGTDFTTVGTYNLPNRGWESKGVCSACIV